MRLVPLLVSAAALARAMPSDDESTPLDDRGLPKDLRDGAGRKQPYGGKITGFPDCGFLPGDVTDEVTGEADSIAAGASTQQTDARLKCYQRQSDFEAQIRVACVGDSITAGAYSSGPNATYPAHLGQLLGNGYKVSNLGASGATLQKKGDSPFWQRPMYSALTSNTWDVVIIMLGTNDAKDATSGGPPNWPSKCSTKHTSASTCTYLADYTKLIEAVRGLGRSKGIPPTILLMTSPPLMSTDATVDYGMNQTVINEILPILVRKVAREEGLGENVIDVFTAMGGANTSRIPKGGCTLESKRCDCGCAYFCDAQSCDQCHPNDHGYEHIARTVHGAVVALALPNATSTHDVGGKGFNGTRGGARGQSVALEASPLPASPRPAIRRRAVRQGEPSDDVLAPVPGAVI